MNEMLTNDDITFGQLGRDLRDRIVTLETCLIKGIFQYLQSKEVLMPYPSSVSMYTFA